ncbi:nicotinate (nicotinamide) nucleotide adenylyltransferase [Conchiformibius kuhniae]|uniref:Probable nicotinate-nucleotide adenylyltransferase n=1 Tax=Conchiformibius kuhniae TaxID=211502 RepID=A0A8T9MWS6_9NEIS|nr:nicotinate (nicotinamide) nucleotide adenylyltransferase [Conchiformibius kuhniae]UOP05604.1 nicotinate (nicotinamide) nucleotide adenylyltransferase [Conchiformibius kuhniae]
MNAIGLFGGTFDPIHNGHLAIARAAADRLGLAQVLLLPAGDPYHKTAPRTPARHRLAMSVLAAQCDPRFAASDCDIVRGGATYTFDTVQVFRQIYPNAQLYWLMGSDSLLQLHTWHKWRELVRQTRFAVAVRAGVPLANAPRELQSWLGEAVQNGSVVLLDDIPPAVSSTQIRQTLASGGDAGACLPESVAAYIRAQGLYR